MVQTPIEFTITSTLANIKLFQKSLSCVSKVASQVQFSVNKKEVDFFFEFLFLIL